MTRYSILLCFVLLSLTVGAQRQTEYLNRGVVAVPKGGGVALVSWRLLASDPENIAFNVYSVSSGGSPVRLNSTPVTEKTNLLVSLPNTSAQNIYVTAISGGTEGQPSLPWSIPAQAPAHRIVKEIDFRAIPGDPGGDAGFSMKFCWPADLDGDGEYDFVVDRQAYQTSAEEGDASDTHYLTPKVEAYRRDGTFLWRIDMGPNVKICSGHDDMVTAYDMDGDNHAEVLMKTSEGTVFADGTTILNPVSGTVTDYRTLTTVAPHYISVVNGMTGVEMARIEMPNKTWRDKADLFGGNYNNHNGHFGIAYLDGIRPSLIFEYSNRNSDKSFNNFVTAWDFRNGQLTERFNWVNPGGIYNDFHQIRIADVDGDGKDEMIEGGFVLDHDGTPLFGTDLVHGDRHRTTDIDPDRPGLETFAIQQNNPTTLGMALYDAATGEMLRRWYQSGVGDVGRGEAIEFHPDHRGLEMFSTMGGIYDAQGHQITSGSAPFPYEGLWWDGDLLREVIGSADGNGFNPVLSKISTTTYAYGRLVTLYNEKTPYYIHTETAARAPFWGDILGDWREELVLERTDRSGFGIISTWDESPYGIYCLMQNPAYRMQATARGYYQTPLPDYYLGTDMPTPPVPPVQTAKKYWAGSASGWDKSTASWKLTANDVPVLFADGDTVLFDLRGQETEISLSEDLSPGKVLFVAPVGTHFRVSGPGSLNGPMELIKTAQGTLTLQGTHLYSGATVISDGSLILDGSLTSTVQVMARGTLGGTGTLSGGVTLEKGLNTEGGRLQPGSGSGTGQTGTMFIQGDLSVPGNNTLDFDIVPGSLPANDSIVVTGNVTVTGQNTLFVRFGTANPQPGTYTLLKSFGTLSATPSNFVIKGLDGIPKRILMEGNEIKIQIDASRPSGTVIWKGGTDNIWDFERTNFVSGSLNTLFVPGDSVIFDQSASRKSVVVNDVLPVAHMLFDAVDDYQLGGAGLISGPGGLTKRGANTLTIASREHTFLGTTRIEGGTVRIESLDFSGQPSSLGSSTEPIALTNSILEIASKGATDRSLVLEGNVTLEIPASSYTVLNGSISGSGQLIKKGSGQVTLGASNTYSGNTTLQAGTILLGTREANIFGLGNSANPADNPGRGSLRFEGGTLRMFEINTTSYTGPSYWNVEVPEGATARWEVPSRWRMAGMLTGKGNLTIMIPYVRSDFEGNWSGFEGTISLVHDGDGDGGDFRVKNNYGYPQADFHLSAGTSLFSVNSGSSLSIGALAGAPGSSLRGANSAHTWVVGTRNTDAVFEGTIADGGGALSIIKRGTADWTLRGASTYSGSTQILEGRLIVNNTSGSATGTGPVQVGTQGILSGNGTISGAVSISGTLEPGLSVGTIQFANQVQITATGRLIAEVSGSSTTTSDKVIAGGTFTANGTLEIRRLSGNYAANDQFTLLQAEQIQGTFSAIVPALPASGYEWDLSRLYTEGVLGVSAAQMPAPVLSQSGPELVVTGSGITTYRWFRNGVLIAGITSERYTPAQSGTYTVNVTFFNGTSGQSNPVAFYITGLDEPETENILYPNPNNGVFYVNLAGWSGLRTLSVESINGRVVYRTSIAGHTGRIEVNISAQPAGVYLVRMSTDYEQKTWKIIKTN